MRWSALGGRLHPRAARAWRWPRTPPPAFRAAVGQGSAVAPCSCQARGLSTRRTRPQADLSAWKLVREIGLKPTSCSGVKLLRHGWQSRLRPKQQALGGHSRASPKRMSRSFALGMGGFSARSARAPVLIRDGCGDASVRFPKLVKARRAVDRDRQRRSEQPA